MHSVWGEKCWTLFDDRLLRTLDALRKRFGPCTINNWSWGGSFNQSGLRDVSFYGSVPKFEASRSQHKFGRAADCKFRDYSASEVRKYVLENPDEFPFITFLEVGINWFHFDVRNGDNIVCWSPDEGYVSNEEVIRRNL
ncbi:hypothetical protein U9608_001221 [Vibrio alginolyticus]|nr:hypothetical protein [Vibrio alginolyticus]